MDINESDFLSKLGNKTKEIRINSDISLEELSRLSSIDVDTLKAIEAGAISVDLMDFVSIAKSLNVPPSTLVEFTK
ncbi:MAG: helix-turn-helix domain-containing protein [bacterium]|jgi:transcriptional regulator with XRE-family HTH domain